MRISIPTLLTLLMSNFLILFQIVTIMAQDEQYIKAAEAKGLEVGTTAPNWTAMSADGEQVVLTDLLKTGPVVIVFYRGHWCPVCNQHLKNLEENLEDITDRGATVVAISPEKSEFLEKTREKTNASFHLLHDEDYKIADAYGVKFRPGAATRSMYNTALGANLKSAHSDDSQQLPIPATYVIDTNQQIVWRHFDPDYKKRAAVEDILPHLPK